MEKAITFNNAGRADVQSETILSTTNTSRPIVLQTEKHASVVCTIVQTTDATTRLTMYFTVW